VLIDIPSVDDFCSIDVDKDQDSFPEALAHAQDLQMLKAMISPCFVVLVKYKFCKNILSNFITDIKNGDVERLSSNSKLIANPCFRDPDCD